MQPHSPFRCQQRQLLLLLTACVQNMVAKTKRLRVMVRGDGVIVGTSADPAWALNALGVDPAKIIHQPMAQYVDVFADVSRGRPAGQLTPTLVTGRLLSFHRFAFCHISDVPLEYYNNVMFTEPSL